MLRLENGARRCRAKAEECRRLSESLAAHDLRYRYKELADAYDSLAQIEAERGRQQFGHAPADGMSENIPPEQRLAPLVGRSGNMGSPK